MDSGLTRQVAGLSMEPLAGREARCLQIVVGLADPGFNPGSHG